MINLYKDPSGKNIFMNTVSEASDINNSLSMKTITLLNEHADLDSLKKKVVTLENELELMKVIYFYNKYINTVMSIHMSLYQSMQYFVINIPCSITYIIFSLFYSRLPIMT